MLRIGLVCPAVSGHLNPMTTLGHELLRRGHEVALIGPLDARAKAEMAGLEFCSFGENEYPLGAFRESLTRLGTLSGKAALRYTIDLYAQATRAMLGDGARAIEDLSLDGLLIDQTSTGAASVAEALAIPFVSAGNALIMNEEEDVPPFVTSWRYNRAWWARIRNRIGYWKLGRVFRPVAALLAEYRTKNNLPVHSHVNQIFSRLAQISQLPAGLDFPRRELPRWFHFTGPFLSTTIREPIPFPYEELTGQPLVYASMGTIQNRQQGILHAMAAACAEMDVQLVISLGGAEPTLGSDLPGKPLVVPYAPQLELLEKAALVITHAGLNTVLESLSYGVPMVAIPIANDQPGVASRVAWTGVGQVVTPSRANPRSLRQAIERVIKTESYKLRAADFQRAIREAQGLQRAAEIAERAIAEREAVIAPWTGG